MKEMTKDKFHSLVMSQLHGYAHILSCIANEDCEDRQKRKKMGCFDFIAQRLASAADLINQAVLFIKKDQNIEHPKFLDCGCGYGNIMLAAYHLGCAAYGIDLNEKALRLARITAKNIHMSFRPFKVSRRNIQTYKHYGRYDIVYYFCPMRAHSEEVKFEKWLADEMRVGSIIIPCYSSETFNQDKRFVQIQKLSEYGQGGNIQKKVEK